jgi:hypothetical protein
VLRSGIATFVKERTQVGRRPESQTTALAGPSPQPIKDGAVDVRKTVDVFVQDRLVASYPVVAMAIDRPTDMTSSNVLSSRCATTTGART